jgi:hypothetical protein
MKKIFFVTLILFALNVSAQQPKVDSVAYYKAKCDSLKSKLFLANFQIEKVKYYVKICQRKPTQKRFLLGWVSDAVKARN